MFSLFIFNDLKLKGPNYNLETCLKRNMTYSIQLFIPAEYAYPIESKADIQFFSEKLPELGNGSKKVQ